MIASDEGVTSCMVCFVKPKAPIVDDSGLIVVSAGANWDEFVAWTVDEGLAGVACLSGIPGQVGAAPIQNIGAYGEEVADVIEWVEVVHLDSLKRERMSADECEFGYRDSIFKRRLKGKAIVTRVAFALEPNGYVQPQYAELIKSLGAQASLTDTRQAVLSIRRGKGMTLDHGFGYTSAGSFFMNPIVSNEVFDNLRETLGSGVNVPSWKVSDGRHKLAAAWLIEQSGFTKGLRENGVGISPRHALSLVHFENGSTTALLSLAVRIQQAVFERFGVWLVMEPELVGKGLESFSRLKRDTPE